MAEEGDVRQEKASSSCVLQRRGVKVEAVGIAWQWLPGSTGCGALDNTSQLPTSSVFNSHVLLLPHKPLPVGRAPL